MTVVTDYTALLYYTSNDYGRWNSLASTGTQAVVTYSFISTAELGNAANDPYGASRYWAFNGTQQNYFRQALAEFEDAAGILFVETDGPAMINVFGFDGGEAAGWADLPWATSLSTSQGELAIEGGDIEPGSFGYETVLHEIGHALGLKHPHDGDPTLAGRLDTQENTVMTYEYAGYNVSELGTFDLQALEHIYGSAAGTSGWSAHVNKHGTVVISASSRPETVLAVGQESKVMGRGGNDIIIGREGEDRLIGGRGGDLLIGGTDEDNYSGLGSEADYLNGGRGRDTLFGGSGDDRLLGGGGYDRLIGGDGSDVLTGGKHADVFVFVSADYWEQEVITDFGRGNDRIEFSGTSPDSFRDLTITQTGENTLISYYGNHDIELTGYTGTLTADHFIFT